MTKLTSKSVSGTSFHNITIETTLSNLIKVLGEPQCFQNDGEDKTNVDLDVRNAIDPIKYDEYRKQWEEATKLNVVTDFPLQIDFELNYSCNFTCPMCTWNEESTESKGRQTWFDFEVFKEVINDGVSKGLKSIRLNYINEPLIKKDIVNISKRKQDFKTKPRILTDDILDKVAISLRTQSGQSKSPQNRNFIMTCLIYI